MGPTDGAPFLRAPHPPPPPGYVPASDEVRLVDAASPYRINNWIVNPKVAAEYAVPPLGDVNNPAASAAAILAARPAAPSGTYHILVGGASTQIYCDMTTAGGGWMSFGSLPVGKWFAGNSPMNWTRADYSYGTYNASGAVGNYWRNYGQQDVTHVLFKTGNGLYWMYFPITEIYERWSSVAVTASSGNFPSQDENSYAFIANRNRPYYPEDPWISVGASHTDGQSSMIVLWGENNPM